MFSLIPYSGTGKMIAVVDDDPSVCKGIDRLLRSEGFRSAVFRSAEACLAHPDLSAVDCFLVDVYLGTLSGFDLARKLRDEGYRTPVVFMTGHDEGATR